MTPNMEIEVHRLKLAALATGAGIWDLDIDADRLECDDRWHSIVGLDLTNPVSSMDQFRPLIHPDDVERAAEVHATFADLTARDEDYHILYRIIRPDGELRWIKSAACLMQAGRDGPNRAVGAIIDVTDEVAASLALAESEKQFKILADTVPQIIFWADPDGKIDFLNKRWRQFTGSEGLIAEENWFDYVHPEERDKIASSWNSAVQFEESYKAEYRFRHHSGEYRWRLVEAVALRDEKGSVSRWIGSNTDIHSAKLLHSERELVARELDHRLKNVFAIIDGLIRLSTGDDPEVKLFAQLFRSKLTALASAHNLIWQSESTSGVPLQSLLQKILAPYENHDSPRIEMRGANPHVGNRAITPLALLFHELATNSVKYGALSYSAGKLRIDIEHAIDEVRIAWIEAVEKPTATFNDESRKGFGSNLFAIIVEKQLDGKFVHHFSDSGYELYLTLHPSSL